MVEERGAGSVGHEAREVEFREVFGREGWPGQGQVGQYDEAGGFGGECVEGVEGGGEVVGGKMIEGGEKGSR